jgi:hypothetical protein
MGDRYTPLNPNPKMIHSSILRFLFAIALPIFFVPIQTLNAQTKIEGKYNSKTKKFEATNTAYSFGDFIPI